jgi:hypothetical protein
MGRKDLDEIFSKAKKTSVVPAIQKRPVSSSASVAGKYASRTKLSHSRTVSHAPSTKSSRKTGSVADPFGLTPAQSSNSLDFTEEGWKVYTPEELNIGKGGDTPDCPFDCNCCF